MLLKLVELRSSDWGRVRAAAAASNATPDNDPNYFMVSVTISYSHFSFFKLSIVSLMCLSWMCLFFPLRMNLHSTQKMALLLQQQTQVRLCMFRSGQGNMGFAVHQAVSSDQSITGPRDMLDHSLVSVISIKKIKT